MRKTYPGDITQERFELTGADLSAARRRTHPGKYRLYDIFRAVLYLLKEGCTRRAVPHGFPKWENVRYHCDIRAKPGEKGISIPDRVLRKPLEAERGNSGRRPGTTMVIGLLSVPGVSGMRIRQKQKAVTPVKKNGIKIHIGVDVPGLPHMSMLTPAGKTDRDGALDMVDYCCYKIRNLFRLKKVSVDGGCSGESFAKAVKSRCPAEVEVVKRNELHTFAVLLGRWIAGRSPGWPDKCRRLWKNREHKLQNTFQMVSLAFIRLFLKRY